MTTRVSPSAIGALYWPNIVWFTLVHAMAVLALCYIAVVHFSWATVGLATALFFLCHIAITAGSHRLYTHRAYKAARALQLFLLAFFSAVFQDSFLWWTAMHHRHHMYTDTARDPHNIKRGFWWAHIGWLLHKPIMPNYLVEVRYLTRNKLVMFQHKYWGRLGILIGFVAPTVLASLWGDFLGGFLVGGFLRLMVQYHGTWIVNSVSHYIGPQPYGTKNSSRDSPWWLMLPAAILSVGESTRHNKHHWLPRDVCIGDRWYDIDPGKWFVILCSWVGLAWDLKRFDDSGKVLA